jgi:hypothetical protein
MPVSLWILTVEGESTTVFALIFFNLLARKPNLEKNKLYLLKTNSFIIFTFPNPGICIKFEKKDIA